MKLKQNSLVVFVPPCTDEEWERQVKHAYPFNIHEVVLFLGEIKQMPGHCIVARRNGKVIWGYHTDNFRTATEDEI